MEVRDSMDSEPCLTPADGGRPPPELDTLPPELDTLPDGARCAWESAMTP